MRTPFRFLLPTVVLLALGFVVYAQQDRLADVWRTWNEPPLPAAVSFEDAQQPLDDELMPVEELPVVPVEPPPVEPSTPPVQPPPVEPPPSSGFQVPASFNLAVPFTPQAPTANWDEFHQDTCEEASLLMVHRFYEGDGEGVLPVDDVEEELRRIADFQDVLFGANKDSTAMQMGIVAEQLYGYSRVQVLDDPTADDIKRIVASGYPVIVPAAGRELGNPYFTPPGPNYHMLVVRGYTDTHFIVNDPGTRRGENYRYPIEGFMRAIRDWDSAAGDLSDARRILVVRP